MHTLYSRTVIIIIHFAHCVYFRAICAKIEYSAVLLYLLFRFSSCMRFCYVMFFCTIPSNLTFAYIIVFDVSLKSISSREFGTFPKIWMKSWEWDFF